MDSDTLTENKKRIPRTIDLKLDKLKMVREYLKFFLADWEKDIGEQARSGLYFLTQSELQALNIIIDGLEKGQINFSMINPHQLNYIIEVNQAKEIQYGDYYCNFTNMDI